METIEVFFIVFATVIIIVGIFGILIYNYSSRGRRRRKELNLRGDLIQIDYDKADYLLKEKRRKDPISARVARPKDLLVDFDKLPPGTAINRQNIPSRLSNYYTGSSVDDEASFRENNRVRKKFHRYSEFLVDNGKESEIEEINDEIYGKIAQTHPLIIERFPYRPGLVFNFDIRNPYSIIKGVGMSFSKKDEIFIVAFLSKKYPFTVELRKKEGKMQNYKFDSDFYSFFGKNFLLQSNIPDACVKAFSDEKVNKKITSLLPQIRRISINENWLLAFLNKEVEVKDFLDLLVLLHKSVRITEKYGEKLLEIKCYQCEDPFDLTEMTCTNCGASRPTCVVCLLDLEPSEKETVIKLPCCGVYAHDDHIRSWITNNTDCPTCKGSLAKFMREIM